MGAALPTNRQFERFLVVRQQLRLKFQVGRVFCTRFLVTLKKRTAVRKKTVGEPNRQVG